MMPSGQPRYRRGDRPVLPIVGGESRPGETPPAAAPPPASPPATPPAEPPAAATPPESDAHDPAKAQRVIEALRAEIRDLKPKVQAGSAAAARLQELEDASKTDLEKAQKKAADLQAALDAAQAERRTLLVRSAIERQARTLGIVDEDAAYRLLDLDALTFGEDGAPTNVEKLLKALLEAKPYLRATTEARPGVPPTPRANGNATADKVAENRQKLAATGAYRPL